MSKIWTGPSPIYKKADGSAIALGNRHYASASVNLPLEAIFAHVAAWLFGNPRVTYSVPPSYSSILSFHVVDVPLPALPLSSARTVECLAYSSLFFALRVAFCERRTDKIHIQCVSPGHS